MGSFNIACVMSNTPIIYGDRVVAYRVHPFTVYDGRAHHNDPIRSSHFVCGFPLRGAYADYGHITLDELYSVALNRTKIGDTEEDAWSYMVFHEDIHDSMYESYLRDCATQEDFERSYYKNKPRPTWEKERELRIEKVILGYEKCVDGTMTGKAKEEFLIDAAFRATDVFFAPEGTSQRADFWFKELETTHFPKFFYQHYKEKVAWMDWAESVLCLRVKPSPYAGQEVYAGAFAALATLTKKRMGKYTEEYEDEE